MTTKLIIGVTTRAPNEIAVILSNDETGETAGIDVSPFEAAEIASRLWRAATLALKGVYAKAGDSPSSAK